MPHKTALPYLIAQAVGGGLWWLSLFLWPETRAWYWPASWPEVGLIAFWLPDLLLFFGGTAMSAWLVAWRSPWQEVALWITSGATLYAALFCISVWLLTGGAGLAALAMAPAAAGTLWVAVTIPRRGDRHGR